MGSRSRVLMSVLFLLAVVSCGGDGSSSETTGAASPTTVQDTDGDAEPADQPTADETDTAGEEAGERSAVLTIDGESTSYTMNDITYSNVDGVEDLTFETCNPDFFGSGRFYAIGYAVDAEGKVLVNDDGELAGIFTMDLPPDDWEETQRDAPGFDIDLGELSIEIASPEEAAGGAMDWTIDDTTASGTAVFVDFENTYTVEFEVTCEGSPTVDVGDLPSDDGDDTGDSGGGFSLAGAGTGSYTIDGEVFDGVDVYRCEPFSVGGEGSHPDDLSLLAYRGGMEGLEVGITNSQGADMTDGTEFDRTRLRVFYSRSGDGGTEQFEGVADAAGEVWYTGEAIDPEDRVELAEPPFVIDGDRISGSLAGLEQTWPDEGAATVDVTFDLEIPTEVNEDC